jgi:hypothetical protein
MKAAGIRHTNPPHVLGVNAIRPQFGYDDIEHVQHPSISSSKLGFSLLLQLKVEMARDRGRTISGRSRLLK